MILLAGRTRTHRAVAAAIASLAIAAPPALAADPPPRSITVVGQSSVTAANDTSRLTFRVETKSRTAAGALGKTSARAQRVIDAVKRAGIAGDDIQTENVSLDRFVRRLKHHRRRTGYRSVNSVIVTVRDVGRTPRVITAAVNAGANGVSGVEFSTSKVADLYAQALSQAYDQARAKAERLARQAGVTLGAPLQIREGVNLDEGGSADSGTAAPRSGTAPPIQPGTATVDGEVTVTFAIS
ncbi:MAG TPA: SIMPL domain-containing protein [Thermoleophilaceae bacterium]